MPETTPEEWQDALDKIQRAMRTVMVEALEDGDSHVGGTASEHGMTITNVKLDYGNIAFELVDANGRRRRIFGWGLGRYADGNP